MSHAAPLVSLAELLAKDGLVPLGSTGTATINCPLPDHADSTPSCSVDFSKGVWYCHACGKGGDAVMYLTQCKGLPMKEALAIVKGTPAAKGASQPKDVLPEGEAVHLYRTAEGETVMAVVRRPGLRQNSPKCLPFTALSDGRWRAGRPGKKPTPIYKLPEVLASPAEKRICIFEGEKCVDRYCDAFPQSYATTWQGGCKAVGRTDWKPLAKRRVLIMADADEAGRDAAQWLAAHLNGLECDVRLWAQKGKDGRDIADMLDELKPAEVRTALLAEAKAYTAPAAMPADPGQVENKVAEIAENRNPYFTILGTGVNSVIIRIKQTQQIMEFTYSRFTVNNLLGLAPLDHWAPEADSLNQKCLHQCTSAIIQAGKDLGPVNLSRLVGRGAVNAEDGLIYHLGDKLLHNGELKDLTLTTWHMYYPALEALPRRAPPDDWQDQAQTLAEEFFDFVFDTEVDALLWLGWIASSLLGGALQWRPMLWVQAPYQTGKTCIMQFAKSILSSYATVLYDASVAGLQRMAGSDALPLLLDEMEPDRIPKGMMDFMRTASSTGGSRIRARMDSDGGITKSEPRSPLYFTSVSMPPLKDTEISRLIIVRLQRRAEGSEAGFIERIRAIEQSIRDRAEAVRNGLIHNMGLVLKQTDTHLKCLLDRGIDARMAHQYAPVCAGVEALGLGARMPLLYTYVEVQQGDKGGMHDDTAIQLVARMLTQDMRYEENVGDRLVQGRTQLYAAALARSNGMNQAAADMGVRACASGLLIDHNHPQLTSSFARHSSLRDALAQIPSALMVRGKPTRFGTRIPRNHYLLPPSALGALSMAWDTDEALMTHPGQRQNERKDIDG